MAADARLLIMDEPTASLTRHEVDALIRLVSDLKGKGICIVFVSHRLDEVLEIAERVTVLRDGAKVGTFAADEIDDRKLATLMTGKALRYETAGAELAGGRALVLSVRGLTAPATIEDVSLDDPRRRDRRPHRPARLGPHRARAVAVRHEPRRLGEIRSTASTVALNTNADAIAEGIAYVSEDRLTLGLGARASRSPRTSSSPCSTGSPTVRPDRRTRRATRRAHGSATWRSRPPTRTTR